MTSNDLTLLLVSDGQDWGKYVNNQLAKFPKVSRQTIVLDHLIYENPPEVTFACQQSDVTLLLVTPEFLEFLETKSGWFSRALQGVPATSAVVLFLLLDQEDSGRLHDLARESYVSADWTFLDPGYEGLEVRQTIAKVLDIVEKCQARRIEAQKQKKEGKTEVHKEREEGGDTQPECREEAPVVTEQEGAAAASFKKKTPPQAHKKPTNLVQFYPSVIHERGVRVAMVFKEEVTGDITLKVEQTDIQLTPQRENEKVFTFLAPELAPGKHKVLILEGDKWRLRSTLIVRGAEMGMFHSPQYLSQILKVRDSHQLDLRLKDIFSQSVPPAGTGLETIFHHLALSCHTEQPQQSEALYPTLLHYAAAYGLSEFCSALLECPGSSQAFHIRNCEGHDPAELAAKGGFEELENYIIDFVEMETAKEIYDRYITMHRLPTTDSDDSEEYETVTPPTRKRAVSEPSVNVPMSPPQTPDWQQSAALPADRRQTSSQDSLPSSGAGRPDRPPLPPPRQKGSSRSVSERRATLPSSLQAISEVEQKTATLPTSPSKMSPAEFMGMGATDPFKPELYKAALGSRWQNELIQVNEMVKSKEINLNDACMLFNAWRYRYGKTPSTSFKDRQKELIKIKTEYQQVRKALNEKDKSSRSILQRLGLGGRQDKSTVRLNISDPVLQREKKQTPRVYSKPVSTSQLPSDRASSASTASSSSSSRDSGWSQGSRDSHMSSTYEGDSEREEVFEPHSSMRRSRTTGDSTKRSSLGHQYLQQTEEETDKLDSIPPVLPPRSSRPPHPLPSSTKGATAHTPHSSVSTLPDM